MKYSLINTIVATLLLPGFFSCNLGSPTGKKTISEDSAIIAKGAAAFGKNCSGCHNFKQGGIGPQLGGITTRLPVEWIMRFVKDPGKMIASGDEHAQQLYKKYKMAMPSFAGIPDDELTSIIAYINTQKQPSANVSKEDEKALLNPITDTIQLSNLVVDLALVTQLPASSASGKMPLTRITKLGVEQNSGNSFVLDLNGKMYKMQQGKPQLYFDIAAQRPKFIREPGLGTGFGSFAFHPAFAGNGLLYTAHTESTGAGKADFGYADSIKVSLQWVLTEWKTATPEAATFSGTGREIFRANMVHVIHGIQEIAFNPNAKPGSKDYGMLYIGVGDGGSVDEGYPFLAHNKDKIWGTILRINPLGHNSANGNYGIPSDNPFVKQPDGTSMKEIYAFGFRNPHRITWDAAGQMIATNIGGGNIESLNLIMPGHDYGWPVREGSFVLNPHGDLTRVFPLPANDSVYNFTYPIAEYDHDAGWTAISGGFEYTGNTIPALKGKFLFGDIPSGRLFYIEMADIQQGKQATIKEWKISLHNHLTTVRELCKNDRADLHFGKDAQGEIYILTKPDGKVYRLASEVVRFEK